MKNKAFVLIFILLFALSFASCNKKVPLVCDTHSDEIKDGICDLCGKTLPEKTPDKKPDKNPDVKPEGGEGILLIDDGEVNFAFVLARKLPSDARMTLDSIADELSESCGEPELFTVGSERGSDVYVYVGIELDKIFDGYTLGYEGYTVSSLDGNIIVSAGSEDALADALEFFEKEVFGEWDGESDFYFSDEMEETVKTKYRTEISVGDFDISEYSIFSDGDLMTDAIAVSVRDTIYKKCGARLEVIAADTDSPKIVVRHAEAVSKGGFRVYESEGDLIIECAYKNKFEESVEKFLFEKIKPGELDFEDLDFSLTVDTVYYDDFGAVGDGKTDDFLAIKAAHDFANECGQTVKARHGATYYIKNMSTDYITVKTNVDFCGASFIIDDSEVSQKFDDGIADTDIFVVETDYTKLSLNKKNCELINALNEKEVAIDRENITKLDLGLGYPALLVINNVNTRQYIRYGSNANTGTKQTELILIDKEGNIDETTPFLFDFKEITSIDVIRIDDEPITVKNGTFTTLATKVHTEEESKYIARGICIRRANTTVSGITHLVEGEIPKGTMVDGKSFWADGYTGFYRVLNTSNVEIRDCIATAHVNYSSSYDISIRSSNNVRLINVRQTEEDFLDTKDWWIMGSNFCKNLLYDGCYLTRFDAHCGVYNATIRNSTVSSLRLIGGGDFVIENSTVKARSYGGDTFIMLREDYGSTWRGNIYIKNCTLDSIIESAKREEVSIIWAQWVNHNFGYETYLPNVYVDGLYFAERLGTKRVNVFKIKNLDEENPAERNFNLPSFSGTENKNVYTAPGEISIKNLQTGVEIELEDSDFFKNTKLEKK